MQGGTLYKMMYQIFLAYASGLYLIFPSIFFPLHKDKSEDWWGE